MESFEAPSTIEVILDLDDQFYDTAPDQFDVLNQALDGVEVSVTENGLKLEGLHQRIAHVDLQRDAISVLLSKEVSKSRSGLMEGMQKVSDLDLDITRTLLHVKNLRRRLAMCKLNMVDSHLLISTLQQQIYDTVKLQMLGEQLEFALQAKQTCERTTDMTLTEAVELAQQSLKSVQERNASKLLAVGAVEQSLRSKIALFDSMCRMEIKQSLLATNKLVDVAKFEDAIKSLKLLGKTPQEIAQCLEEIWLSVVESILQGEQDHFSKLEHACCAVDTAVVVSMGAKQGLAIKEKALHICSASTERFLSSPEVRSLPLAQFSKIIQQCSVFVDKLGTKGCFQFSNEQQHAVRAKLESTVRLRSRIYAQTFQAEGFQAMRQLLWRETWTNVIELESGQDFVCAIFDRLGLPKPPIAKEEEAWVLTATLASGIPRQIQRTMDLMKNLPQSASGEAFLGLQIVFDLYVFALCTVFLPNVLLVKLKGFDPKRRDNNALLTYLFMAKESLFEWISTNEENDLCERRFTLKPGELSLPCLTAGDSLVFLQKLIAALEQPIGQLLPSIERASLGNKTFVDFPQVLVMLQQQCRESAVNAWLRPHVYFSRELMHLVYNDNTHSDFTQFHPVLSAMKSKLQELVNMDSLTPAKQQLLWDEAVRFLFDRFLDALAGMEQCTVAMRGDMAFHLASFWDVLQVFPLTPERLGLRAKMRVDDFIKAYYFDNMNDFSGWVVKNRNVFDTLHFSSVFETGMLHQQQNNRRELKQEFDRLMAGL